MNAKRREQDRNIRRSGHCPYSDSCFECPLPECSSDTNWAYAVNLTEYDIAQKKKSTR